MNIRNSISALKDEITGYRRELHQNPQTSYEEVFASNLIAEKLTAWGIEHEHGWAVTGIVAKIEGEKNTSGKSIGLRADIDALDIFEKSGQEWGSKTPGKMHACGHDGHTSMMLGAAKYLSENRNFDGTVYLIFQPAEEGGGGAIRMIEEGLFKKHKIDSVYGLHNGPMYPKGHIGVNSGPMMASSDEVKITVTGVGGHAAMPHTVKDPVIAAAYLITSLQTIISRNLNPVHPAVLSITNINAGTGANNVVPDTVEILGTSRGFSMETRQLVERKLHEICQNIAGAFDVQIEAHYEYNYDPTVNTPAEAAICAQVAKDLVGNDNVDDNVEPCMGAEDFGAMLQQVPGCYLWLGQAEPNNPNSPHNKGLHNAGYDFNDEVIPLGIEYWVRVVETMLPLK